MAKPVQRPVFARIYTKIAENAKRRGDAEHRRRRSITKP
jgi:hypothetical protein